LNAEQADWRDDTDDEPDDQELEAHYMYIAQIQEVTPDAADNSEPIFDTKPLQKEQCDTNITIDSMDISNNEETVDQDDDDLAKERDLLASLIEKLKCEIDGSKNRNKFLESSNKALVDKLKDLKKFQGELDRYHDANYASKLEIDCAEAKGDLVSYKMESQKSFNEYTRKKNNLNQTISEMKKELFAHQETISIMSQEKEAHNKFYKTRKYKEIEKVSALENKVKYLKKAQRANPRLYDIGCSNDNLVLMLAP
ncbi:gag-pol polyprotein, partial [Tanacetum coccineum]